LFIHNYVFVYPASIRILKHESFGPQINFSFLTKPTHPFSGIFIYPFLPGLFIPLYFSLPCYQEGKPVAFRSPTEHTGHTFLKARTVLQAPLSTYFLKRVSLLPTLK
tara:strand:- start:36262 stop:36582 length:321 start_codon:yes stop_codon:yes gene_type:complete